MALEVIAQSASDFARWQAAQRGNAATTATDEALAGQTLFMKKPCAGCHVIRGTQASGPNGPDLTHVASRRMIGAGLFETSRGSLAAWIADPQTLKPGNNMPLVTLTADELRAISAYMATLQ
jgi:cytochrome c oxidase subunit 2